MIPLGLPVRTFIHCSLVLCICWILSGCAGHHKIDAADQRIVSVDFVVRVNNENFVVRLVKPDQIAVARARLNGTKPQGIISGHLVNGDGGFNRDPDSNTHWSWHIDPNTVSFPQIAMEVCDGRPSDVESNKSHWITSVKMFCPWSAKVIRELK